MTNNKPHNKRIVINIAQQTLTLYQQERECAQYIVSTAKNGIGNQQDSGCTPLGKHVIAQKIGDTAPINSVFVGRVPTGEVYDATLGHSSPARDWILSRILWLSGLEDGMNKGAGYDTYERYIYIRGTPDTEPMGVPFSHGCIRMRNTDIVELFEQVEERTPVDIIAG